ncbi:MAG: hypothetical protein HY858_02605 [Candidatus Solibacter usitatus]|nr:hypothetical protein [Candidatus Solibacter usitatus]
MKARTGSEKRRIWPRLAVLAVALAPAAPGQFGGLGGFGSPGASNPMATGTPQVDFRPWLMANGTWYQSEASRQGSSGSASAYGWNAGGGMSGGKAWERTSVAGSYSGMYMRPNTRSQGFASGMSQVGMLAVSHRMNQQHGISISQFGGSSLGGYGYGAPYGGFGGFGMVGAGAVRETDFGGLAGFGDAAQNGLVDNEVFGSRVNYYGTNASYIYQPSLRWSYAVSGMGSMVRRQQKSLSDLNMYGAGGSASYRLDEKSAVSMIYQYSQFTYVGLFGGNNAHMAGLQYSHSFNDRTQFQVAGGAYNYRSTFLGTVQIDPALAALIGASSSLAVQKLAKTGWVGGATLSHSFTKFHAGASYNHGITPGNGAMLASERDMVTGSLGTSVKRVSFSGYGGYYKLSGLLQHGAKTETFSLGAGGGVRLVGDLHLTANFGAARYGFGSPVRNWQKYATAGLTWSPGGAAFRF